MSPRIPLAAFAAAVIAAIAIAVASAGASDSPNLTQTIPAPPLDTTVVAAVPAEITKNFALFRTDPSPVPNDLVPRIASARGFGRNAQLARAIQTPYGKGWVIPGDGWLCITMPDPVDGYGETCSPNDLALQRGLWLRLAGDSPNAPAADVLLVPDGATVQKTKTGVFDATTGIVSQLGVVADGKPTVTVG